MISLGLCDSPSASAQENCCACSPKMADSQCSIECNALKLPRCPTTTLMPNPAANRGEARGWIGVALGRSERPGALVVRVAPDSPAAKAGLQPSDEIIGFDGNSIPNRDYLVSLVRQEPVGQRVQIDILRSGQHLRGDLVIGEQSASTNLPAGDHRLVSADGNKGVVVFVDEDVYRTLKTTNALGGPADQGVTAEELLGNAKEIPAGTPVRILSSDGDGSQIEVIGGPANGFKGFVPKANLD